MMRIRTCVVVSVIPVICIVGGGTVVFAESMGTASSLAKSDVNLESKSTGNAVQASNIFEHFMVITFGSAQPSNSGDLKAAE